MDEAKDKLIRRTVGVWESRFNRRLSAEEARKLAENAVGFFTVLLEWEARDKEEAAEADATYYAKSA